MCTVVHMLRHGEVDNPRKILYGRLPGYRLSARGVAMAEAAAEALAARDVTAVISSPLERAWETAEPVAQRHGVSPTVDERLVEGDNYFEGKEFAVGEGVLRHPRAWWAVRNPFRPSWSEPYASLAARMAEALYAARDAAEGHEAVCVSHQLPIWTLRRHLAGRRLWHDPRRRECALASITSFHFDDGQLTGVEYAEPAADLIAQSPDADRAKGA